MIRTGQRFDERSYFREKVAGWVDVVWAMIDRSVHVFTNVATSGGTVLKGGAGGVLEYRYPHWPRFDKRSYGRRKWQRS